MPLPFLDTNVLLRHLLGDHPEQSPKATALLGCIEQGKLKVQLSEMVVFEATFTLERSYQVPKEQIRHSLMALLALSGIVMRGKRRYVRIFDIYVNQGLPFGDAFIIAEMERDGADQIFSFDREFDGVAHVRRQEPKG